eukprot:149012-Rhodomonas_salina.1
MSRCGMATQSDCWPVSRSHDAARADRGSCWHPVDVGHRLQCRAWSPRRRRPVDLNQCRGQMRSSSANSSGWTLRQISV